MMLLHRYHRNLKSNTLIFIGTVPLLNYQSLILPSPNKIGFNVGDGSNVHPDKSADPTYGGYPSGYPAFSPGSGYPSTTPTAPEPPPNYNSDIPAQIQPNSNFYPNLREYLLHEFKLNSQIHKYIYFNFINNIYSLLFFLCLLFIYFFFFN